ncbi:hypothetical protein KORDIASMS9_01165 [Kordia sp. SMS9]|uniref:hypothetical protein n=1 Tax=Kordia sp. SMS9 TaxID=2282170 RepID=UPI000E0D78A1|nr:hypothetical protein [Kordia sp. SMS9]AXG68946.1 hypothetical protein KORDIASMS9_01165 [Kordia sp. SMS9]
MKNNACYIVLLIFLGFFSCDVNSEKNADKTGKKTIETSKDTISPKVNSHESEPKKNSDLTSKLKEKVARLATLAHKYQLKNLEVVSPKKSMLLGSLQRVLQLKGNLKAIDIAIFKNKLHKIHKAFLKGTKPMQTNGNTYPRVTVEEYIFKTPESAEMTYEMLLNSKSESSVWMYVSKAPYELFVEENRLYFVSSGGFYMMDMYKDIVEKLKD